MRIRATRLDDLEPIREIELRAGAPFHEVGMPEIATATVPPAADLAGYVRAGLSWVAAGQEDRPAAFVLVKLIDGLAHIEQISVDPRYARQRVGRSLIDRVDAWAAGRGISALTLTTFRSVPWNAPYYARLGFVVVPDRERGPELTALMAEEARHGLDPAERVAMVRTVKVVDVVSRGTLLSDVDGLAPGDLGEG